MIPVFYAKISGHIEGFWLIINTVLRGIWKVLHEGILIRRASLLAAWILTFETFHWAMQSGSDALTMGAVLTPTGLLMAAIIKFYGDSRNGT